MAMLCSVEARVMHLPQLKRAHLAHGGLDLILSNRVRLDEPTEFSLRFFAHYRALGSHITKCRFTEIAPVHQNLEANVSVYDEDSDPKSLGTTF